MSTRVFCVLAITLILAAPALPRAVDQVRSDSNLAGLTSTVVVKFRDGVDVGVEGNRMALKSGVGALAVETIARAMTPDGLRPTFDGPAEELRAERARLEAESGADLADLSLFFDVRTASPAEAARLARELEALDGVETAFVRRAPIPMSTAPAEPASDLIAAPVTPDFSATQFYLNSAPGGFGIRPVQNGPGGRGQGVRVIDIEYSWNLDHEDLPFDETRQPFVYEPSNDPFNDNNHGTAVLGMLIGADNGFGVNGMCPDIEIGLISPIQGTNDYRLADAIDRASQILTRNGARGDIIQIEQQAVGISKGIAALPAEWDDDVFEAIKAAVARGVVVVEAAGNGGVNKKNKPTGANLDDPLLQGKFNRDNRDSGAIIVGGGDPQTADTSPTSNYGSRLDVQGYGRYVTTLGYGDIYSAGPDAKYTGKFSGTSSATPCVTAVAAIIQASLRAGGLPELTPQQMRSVLVGTGSPDGSFRSKRVGPRPNAQTAVAGVGDPAIPLITSLSYSKKRDEFVADGLYFHGTDYPTEQQTVIYIDGTLVATNYRPGLPGPNGSTPQLVGVGAGALLEPGKITFVEVGDATGTRSPRRVFVRKKAK